MEKTAVGYVRGSDEATLSAQERLIRAMAEIYGFDLREVYREKGASEGPRFNEMLGAIDQQPVDALLVAGNDRLARARTRLAAVRDWLARRGVRIASSKGNSDESR